MEGLDLNLLIDVLCDVDALARDHTISRPRLCCECGVPIVPNAANTCINCLRIRHDISAGIPKQVRVTSSSSTIQFINMVVQSNLYFCRGCELQRQELINSLK